MVLFIPSNNFWQVGELYDFGKKKLLGTHGDGLSKKKFISDRA
jgi:hypothetical protein